MPLIDPYRGFRFRVEIAQITVAHVTEVTGLQFETETEAYEEGGVNDFVHILPKRSKLQNITLKRGITDLRDLWKWREEVIRGTFERKDLTIILKDIAGNDTKWRWEFFKAYPVKWTGPELKGDSNTVAFETIELAHELAHKG
jgi:phage tail-like protein